MMFNKMISEIQGKETQISFTIAIYIGMLLFIFDISKTFLIQLIPAYIIGIVIAGCMFSIFMFIVLFMQIADNGFVKVPMNRFVVLVKMIGYAIKCGFIIVNPYYIVLAIAYLIMQLVKTINDFPVFKYVLKLMFEPYVPGKEFFEVSK